MNWKSMLLLTGIVAVAVSAAIPTTHYTSNCGGNSAALSRVQSIALLAILTADDAADHTFRLDAVDHQQRKQLAYDSGDRWVLGAHFLVSTQAIVRTTAKDRKIIAVCGQPFNNVPRRTFFSAPYTHAVGYSDGSKGLISTKEFAALDLSKFKALDELFPSPAK